MPSTHITIRVPTELLEELDRWRASRTIPASRAAVIRAAIQEWITYRQRAEKKFLTR